MNNSMNNSQNSMNSINFDEPRRSSIKFNPEPSILEIEPREIDSEIKLDGISFEDLDNTAPVSLEFEEL